MTHHLVIESREDQPEIGKTLVEVRRITGEPYRVQMVVDTGSATALFDASMLCLSQVLAEVFGMESSS
jgi:hypothetical protein